MTNQQLIFNLALALRRLLLKVDKRSSAARSAAIILEEAEKVLKSN